MLFALFLGLPCNQLEVCNINGRSGGVSVLQVDDDGRRVVRSLNDMSYLNYRIPCPHA